MTDDWVARRMSKILRHSAVKEKICMNDEGFINISLLVKHLGTTADVILKIVATNSKKRFALSPDGKSVRANQGHGLPVTLALTELTPNSEYDTCLHGTTIEAAKLILENGLSKMSRNHIHFAIGMPGADGVISGMRKSSSVVFVLDMKRAMTDGIVFYMSANGVILSEGIDGIIPQSYFKEVLYPLILKK
jgi:2'-phosphotransferase